MPFFRILLPSVPDRSPFQIMNARDNQLCRSVECRCRDRTSYLEVRREARAFELQSVVLGLLWTQHLGDGCSASGHRMSAGKNRGLHSVHMFFLGSLITTECSSSDQKQWRVLIL